MFPSEVEPPPPCHPKASSPAVPYGPLGILTTHKNVKNLSHQPKEDTLRNSGTYLEVLVGFLLSPVPPSEKFCSILRNPLVGDANSEVKSRGGPFIRATAGDTVGPRTRKVLGGQDMVPFIQSHFLPQSIYAMNPTQ